MKTGLPWLLVEYDFGSDGVVSQCLPKDDIKTHDEHLQFHKYDKGKYRSSCWCEAKVNEDGLVVHNSADGREQFEESERKLS